MDLRRNQDDGFIVSVALCTYNGEDYIAQQLSSILSQTRTVDEIVVSDDGSSDDTISIVRNILRNNGVKSSVVMGPHKGITANFENAIAHCSGDIIFLSDQDDLWSADKVEKMLVSFSDPDVMLAFCDAVGIDERGNVLYQSWHSHRSLLQSSWSKRSWTNCLVREGQIPNGCFMAIRRGLFDQCRNFYDGKYQYHDAWLINCASVLGKCIYIPTQLTFYRIHLASTTQSALGQDLWKFHTDTELNQFQKRFSLNVYRSERIQILREITRRYKRYKYRYFYRQDKKAIKMYDRLVALEHSTFSKAAFLLILSFADGCYKFRICDKATHYTKFQYAKMLCADLRFLASTHRS